MDKSEISKENIKLHNRSESDEDLRLEHLDALTFDYVPLTGLDSAKGDDILLDGYESDQCTRLDAVLDNVHWIIDGLADIEDIDESTLTSEYLVVKATQQVKTPQSVNELVFELSGSAGLEEANHAAYNGQLQADSDAHYNRFDQNVNETKPERRTIFNLTETNLNSDSLAIADKKIQETGSANVNENNIQLNLLNKQVLTFENHQQVPSLDTFSFNQEKKQIMKENENIVLTLDRSQTSRFLANRDRGDSARSKPVLRLLKKSKSQNSEYFAEKLFAAVDDQDQQPEHSSVSEQLQSPKEKKKVTASLSNPDKTTTIRKVFLAGKRKISSGKEPNGMKKQTAVDSSSCLPVEEENRSRIISPQENDSSRKISAQENRRSRKISAQKNNRSRKISAQEKRRSRKISAQENDRSRKISAQDNSRSRKISAHEKERLRKISAQENDRSRKTSAQENERMRKISAHKAQSPNEIIDDKQGSKADKSLGGTLKKNFWTIEKKLGLHILGTHTIEEKDLTEEHDSLINEDQSKRPSLKRNETDPESDSLSSPEVLKRNKVIPKGTKASSVCLERHVSIEREKKKRTSASPRLMRKFRLALPLQLSPDSQSPAEKTKLFPRVDSEPKLLHSLPNEFSAAEEAMQRRRATMDSATARSKISDSIANIRKKNPKDLRNPNCTSSLPHRLHHASMQNPDFLGSRFTPNLDSDGSFQGSKDSLEDNDDFIKPNFGARHNRMKRTENMDEQQLEFLRRVASNKTKKKLRKSMRYVGKSPSVPAYEGEDMAGRTWLPEGDCSWRNLSGDSVSLESTKLQSLSELECDALRKVSLSRLHDAELGVSISVPKDDSKLLDRKVSLKKRYGVHLSSKEKNKDKNFDHVFGIPLVNVVENDQLLRLQKSAYFAPSMDYQQQNDQTDTSSGVPQGAMSGPPSDTGSSSGSTTSIHNHAPAYHEEMSSSNRDISNSVSSEHLNSIEEVPRSQEMDNVFNNKDNPNSSQSQTPTSAKSTGTTAAQPLRRRGAIAADSINEIDPYQSQLLEALSLSVSGGTTHSQKKEKKRSLLPPTMVQVPYVVQKCCDHLQKYGLNQAGIFRVPGSKKRVKQLREQFDRGIDVTIDETYNPHDVAALLKEFFRDLPEALLTRELYPVFLQTTKLQKNQDKLACLRYLVWLLPLTNRDTLHTLLQFLALVAGHAEDSFDAAGSKLQGNKMTVTNLATIFGPNILHRYKKSPSSNGDGHHYQVQSVEKPEENSAVIKVIEEVISNQVLLFQIPKEEHNQMLRILKESEPEAVDFLLRRKAANSMREKSRLLGSHSSSPNSSKSFPQRHPVGFCKDVAELPNETDSDSEVVDQTGRSETDHIETNPPAVMRLSYQQATGHIILQSNDKQDKGGFFKNKRPFFMKSRSHPSHSDEEKYPLPHHDDEFDDIIEITDGVSQLNSNLNHIDLPPDEDVPTTPWYAKCDQRSMSFTDDDLEAILGGKSTSGSIRDSSEAVSKTPIHENEDSDSLKQLSEVENEKADSQLAPDETRFEEEPRHVIRAANSSDSGVYVEPCRIRANSASDPIQRRGGFSLHTSPDEELEESCEEPSPSKSEIQLKVKFDASKLQSTDMEQDPDFEKRKDSVLDNSSECSEDDDVSSSNSLTKTFLKEVNISLSTEDQEEPTHFAKNSEANIPRSQLSNENICAGQLRIKSICQEQMLDSDSESSHTQETQKVSPFSSTSSLENVATTSPQRKTPSSPSNTATSFRPKVQRQYAPNPSCLDTSVAIETKPMKREVESKTIIVTEVEPSQEQPKSLNHFRTETANVVIKSPKRSPASRGVNVAMLAGRYNKNDKALTAEPKLVPGAKWTSSGLIGTSPNLNNNRKRPMSLNDKKYQTPLNNNTELPPWHAAVKDQTKLPETLV